MPPGACIPQSACIPQAAQMPAPRKTGEYEAAGRVRAPAAPPGAPSKECAHRRLSGRSSISMSQSGAEELAKSVAGRMSQEPGIVQSRVGRGSQPQDDPLAFAERRGRRRSSHAPLAARAPGEVGAFAGLGLRRQSCGIAFAVDDHPLEGGARPAVEAPSSSCLPGPASQPTLESDTSAGDVMVPLRSSRRSNPLRSLHAVY